MDASELYFRVVNGSLALCLILYSGRLIWRVRVGMSAKKDILRALAFLVLSVRFLFIAIFVQPRDGHPSAMFNPGNGTNTSAALATVFLASWLLVVMVEMIRRSKSVYEDMLSQVSQKVGPK